MRIASLVLVVCFALTLSAQTSKTRSRTSSRTSAPTSAAEDRRAIEDLHSREIRAAIGLDVDSLESLWDEQIMLMPPHHEATEGSSASDAYVREIAKQLDRFEILAFNEQWQELRMMGDYAYEVGTITGRVRPMAGGTEIEGKYDAVRVLKRQADGSWKVYRSIWNQATPLPQPKAEPPKAEEQQKNRLKDDE